jgi:hypothetical protein
MPGAVLFLVAGLGTISFSSTAMAVLISVNYGFELPTANIRNEGDPVARGPASSGFR